MKKEHLQKLKKTDFVNIDSVMKLAIRFTHFVVASENLKKQNLIQKKIDESFDLLQKLHVLELEKEELINNIIQRADMKALAKKYSYYKLKKYIIMFEDVEILKALLYNENQLFNDFVEKCEILNNLIYKNKKDNQNSVSKYSKQYKKLKLEIIAFMKILEEKNKIIEDVIQREEIKRKLKVIK